MMADKLSLDDEELSSSESLEELKVILSKLSDENPVCDTLFKEKYQIILLDNFLPWQKPLGELYEKTITVCSVKPRTRSETSSIRDEVFSQESGCPLSMTFDRSIHRSSSQSRTHSLVMALNEKYHLLPLSQNIGRKILSIYNTIEIGSSHLPVIAICHGKNTKSVVLLGSHKTSNSTLMVTNKGSVTKEEQLQRIEALEEIHRQGFPPFSNIETSVYVQYDFLEHDPDKKSILNPIKGSSIAVKCQWSESLALLEPVTASSLSVAKIKAVSGCTQTGAFSFYKEILILEAFQNCYETGVISWPSKTGECLMKRVKDFINAEMTTRSSNANKGTLVIKKFAEFDTAVLRTRDSLDFSDKLWLILKDCASIEELQDIFKYVFKSLREFLTPPYVYQKNKSTMAFAVKGMLEKSNVFPEVTPNSVVQYLIEIGVEKLRRDYVTLFLGLELIPLECVSYFLQPKLDSVDAITCLKKLHSVLELAIIGVKRLCFTKPLLGEFVRTTLKHYTTVPDIDLSHVFSFEIPTVHARQLLNPMRPTVWEISFLSSVNGYMKQSIHRYVTTPTRDHLYAPENYHPKVMLKTAKHSYFTATLVQHEQFQV